MITENCFHLPSICSEEQSWRKQSPTILNKTSITLKSGLGAGVTLHCQAIWRSRPKLAHRSHSQLKSIISSLNSDYSAKEKFFYCLIAIACRSFAQQLGILLRHHGRCCTSGSQPARIVHWSSAVQKKFTLPHPAPSSITFTTS